MEFLVYVLLLLLTGCAVGFASGLLGVGGGFLMVPIQYFLLTAMGLDSSISLRIAFATSLAVILPTTISGTLGHLKKGAVNKKIAIHMGITSLLGGLFGAFISTQVPASYLKIVFGILLLAVGTKLFFSKTNNQKENLNDNILLLLILGFAVGTLSGLLGIGGGIAMVPILSLIIGLNMREVVGTNSAIMIFSATGGLITYLFMGLSVSGLPEYSLGYINLLQMFLIAVTSVPFSQLGVWVAHRISPDKIKTIFIILIYYMALKMIGLFEFLGLTL